MDQSRLIGGPERREQEGAKAKGPRIVDEMLVKAWFDGRQHLEKAEEG